MAHKLAPTRGSHRMDNVFLSMSRFACPDTHISRESVVNYFETDGVEEHCVVLHCLHVAFGQN